MIEAYLRHRDEIASLIDERFYPLDHIEQRIEAGTIGLLYNDTSLIGIEIKDYPGGAKELHGLFACGELSGILELIDRALILGCEVGCTHATISSREGWSKLLKGRGFVPHQTSIIRELR